MKSKKKEINLFLVLIQIVVALVMMSVATGIMYAGMWLVSS